MAKAVLVYGSTRENTARLARSLPQLLAVPLDVFNAANIQSLEQIDGYDVYLFFASTWGDGELQIDMENFFVKHRLELTGKAYAICELGNYYGYDDFEFGALHIMQGLLARSGGRELIEPFCMDSLPRKDLENFQRWLTLLNDKLRGLP